MSSVETPGPSRSWLATRRILSPAGTGVLAADFGDQGLWCAALTNPGHGLLVQRQIGIIDPVRLDRQLGTWLTTQGRVPSDAPPAELAAVAADARLRLADRDGVFLMGTESIRLLRVSREDLALATEDEFSELVATLSELREQAGTGSEVLWGPGFAAWPGVPEQLAELGWQQQVTPLGVPRHRRRRAAESSPATDLPAPGAPVDRPAVDRPSVDLDRPTDVLPRIADVPETITVLDDVPDLAEVEDAEFPADDAATGPIPGIAVPAADRVPGRHRNRRRPRLGHRARVLAVGAGLVAVLAGGATAVAVTGPDTGEAVAPPSSVTSTEAESDDTAAPYADPGEVDAAGAPVVRYRSPAPEPTTTTAPSTAERPAAPNPPPRERPRPNVPIPVPEPGATIPNPIPGLPPIVLPG